MHNILFVDDELIYKLTIQNLVDWENMAFPLLAPPATGKKHWSFLRISLYMLSLLTCKCLLWTALHSSRNCENMVSRDRFWH